MIMPIIMTKKQKVVEQHCCHCGKSGAESYSKWGECPACAEIRAERNKLVGRPADAGGY
jgi:hypothetical protein